MHVHIRVLIGGVDVRVDEQKEATYYRFELVRGTATPAKQPGA